MKNNINFYKQISEFKNLVRTGWKDRKISNAETVPSHTYGTQPIVFDLAKELGECPYKAVYMMWVHDTIEMKPEVGDIPPHSGVSSEEKAKLEYDAAVQITEETGNSEFLEFFVEFQENKTVLANLCHDADQLDCLVQALHYTKKYPEKYQSSEEVRGLDTFWPYARKKITTKPAKWLYNELLVENIEFLKEKNISLSATDSLKFNL